LLKCKFIKYKRFAEQIDEECLELLQETNKNSDFGDAIPSSIVQAFKPYVGRVLSKERMQELKDKLKVPVNFKEVAAPRMNSEIWTCLPSRVRFNDLKNQQMQNYMSMELVTLSLIATETAQSASKLPKEFVQKILSLCKDGTNVAGSAIQEMNVRRKLEVKPHLNPEYAGICSASTTVSEQLFGDNLPESLKATKTTSELLKKTMTKSYRSKPYDRTSGFSLNRFRPPFNQQQTSFGHRGSGPSFRQFRPF
jgi:hypothetical protein